MGHVRAPREAISRRAAQGSLPKRKVTLMKFSAKQGRLEEGCFGAVWIAPRQGCLEKGCLELGCLDEVCLEEVLLYVSLRSHPDA